MACRTVNVKPKNAPADRLPTASQPSHSRITRYFWWGLVTWSLIVGLSLAWNISHERDRTLELARQEARSNLQKDVALRRWATSHGGIYVKPTAETPPSPFLDTPDSNIRSTEGLELTLMDPAYLVRELQTFYGREYGVKGRITGLRPLNPGSMPDDWERSMLQQFIESNSDFATAAVALDNAPHMRAIQSMRMEEGCLACHAAQGFQVGEVCGGVSATVPLEPYFAREQPTFIALSATHGGIWLIGLFALGFGSYRARHSDKAEKRAGAERRLAASVFDNSTEGIIITDPSGVIVRINTAFSTITGYLPEEVVGQTSRMLRSGRHSDDFYATLWHEIRHNGHWSGEIWNRRKNGEIFPEWLSIAAVHEQPGEITHFIGIFSDISDRKQEEARLEQIAHYDALTQLPNRILIADRLEQAIAQTRRSGTLLAVCYLDLDNFKPVNDTHGHEAGDFLLIEVANRLKSCVRGGDTVGRLGGDEFVILISDIESVEECERALNRICHVVAEPYNIRGVQAEVTASIGVTLYPTDGGDPDTLLRHADQAMYAAKQAGRQRYTLFDPEHDRRARAHREAMSRIEAGLADGEFRLHYQPKVNMRTGAVVGAEALIRWQHPERGLLAPGEFLPAIESSQAAITLDNWVLGTALAQMSQWRLEHKLVLPVSVNIGARSLQSDEFVSMLSAALAHHPEMSAGQLQLEVLETAALEDIARVSRLIDECKKLGVSFALDDFGTGYSSLTYFKRLPAEVLKIDQSFVRDILRDPEDLAIVEGVIHLTEAFHRHAVAEGVETPEHGMMLLQLGCSEGQGYGIARPMPPEALPRWIEEFRPDPRWATTANHPLPREDLPLLGAELEHAHWVKNIAACIAAAEGDEAPAPPPLDAHHCRFGRWIDGPGQLRYSHLKPFRSIQALHLEAHELGIRVLALHADGKAEEAQEPLAALLTVRDQLIDALHEMGDAARGNK